MSIGSVHLSSMFLISILLASEAMVQEIDKEHQPLKTNNISCYIINLPCAYAPLVQDELRRIEAPV